MNEVLIKDGVKYQLWKPEDEVNEFEPLIKDYIKDIFGNGCKYFPKQKLKTLANRSSIPEGFVIDFKNQKWYIVELKLLGYDAINRISGQIVDYKNAIENPRTRKQIFESIRDSMDDPPKFLYDLIFNKEPTIIVVIDNLDGVDGGQFKEKVYGTERNAKIVEFKTFARVKSDNSGIIKDVYIHEFKPIVPYTLPPPSGKPVEGVEEKERVSSTQRGMRLEGDYFPIRFSKEISVKTANWLIKKGKLKHSMIPIETGKKRFLINFSPTHKSGDKFWMPVKLDNGWYLETHASEERNIYLSKKLLKICGYSPDDVLKFVNI